MPWAAFRTVVVALLAGMAIVLGGCEPRDQAAPPPTGTSFSFDERVTPQQRGEITKAADLTTDWLQGETGSSPPWVHLTAEPDGTAFLARLATEYHATPAELQSVRQAMRGAAGLTVGHEVLILVNDRWQHLGAESRSFVVAHEVFHVAQFALASGKSSAPAGGDVPGPSWLVEGSADYVAAQVMASSGGRSFTDYLGEYRARGQSLGGSLEDLDRTSAHAAAGPEAPYTLGFLATEQLIERSSAGALLAPWRRYGSGESWERAFVGAFGVSTAVFEQQFDAGLQGPVMVAAGY